MDAFHHVAQVGVVQVHLTFGREVLAQALHEPSAGFVDLAAEMGRDDLPFAAVQIRVGERRIGHRHLQRVGL